MSTNSSIQDWRAHARWVSERMIAATDHRNIIRDPAFVADVRTALRSIDAKVSLRQPMLELAGYGLRSA